MAVNIPLTGTGQTSAAIATEQIGGNEYQYMKLVGTSGSTVAASVLATTPGSGDGGIVSRIIGSTAFAQAATLTAGSTDTAQFVQTVPYSTGTLTRTTVNTSVDSAVVNANTSRKALIIANLTTAQVIGLGLSTAAVTTGRANVNLYIPALSQVVFGLMGNLPLYTGPIRGLIVSSSVTSGGVGVSEWT